MSVKLVPMGSLITEIRNGLNSEQYETASNASMLPITRIETISAGTVDFSRVNYTNVSHLERIKYQLQQGDILLSHINSPDHIGKTAIFRSDRPLIHGVNLLLLRPNPAVCYPEYLNYYLKSFGPRATFRSHCKKAVNQASLNQGDVASLLVPRLSLPEQKWIASVLKKADRLRRLRHYALELSDTYMQSVFLEMFGDPLTNPMEWAKSKIGAQIVNIRYGTGSPPQYVEKGNPFIRATNVKNGRIEKNDLVYISDIDAKKIPKCKVDLGDIILVRSGVNTGDCAVIPEIYHGAYAAYDLIIEVPFPLNYYYALLINSNYGKSIIEPLSRRAGQPHINAEQVKSLSFPIPDRPLIEKFAQIVQKLEYLQSQQREAERQAEHLFQTLLHKAFRGELTGV